jgi:DNA polymerase-3 subunit epsilon/ATP-dependent DNA helicase DinG
MPIDYVAIDLETTGLNADRDAIIELAAVRFGAGGVTDTFQSLLRPAVQVPLRVLQLTGISAPDLAMAPAPSDVLPAFADFIGDRLLVGHSIGQDVAFLRRAGLALGQGQIDTFELATVLLPGMGRYGLSHLVERLGLPVARDAHRALADAQMHRLLFEALLARAAGLPRPILAAAAELAERVPSWQLGPIFSRALTSEGVADAKASVEPWPAPNDEAWPDAPPGSGPDGDPDPERLEGLLAPGGRLESLAPAAYEDRPVQRRMLRAVARTFAEEGQLLVEAGTGTGKTLAYLLPAAAWAARGEPVVVATHTVALQEQILRQDLPLARRILDWPLRAEVLKGRSHYLCRSALERFLRRPQLDAVGARFAAKLLIWSRMTRSGDRAELLLPPEEQALWRQVSAEHGCPTGGCSASGAGACWLPQARARAAAADLVLVNHALLLADHGADRSLLPAYRRLVIDEAHHLEEAATHALSIGVDRGSLEALLVELQAVDGPLALALATVESDARAARPQAARVQAAAETARGAAAACFTELDHFLAEVQGGRHAGEVRFTEGLRRQAAWLGLELAVETLLDRLAAVLAQLDALEGSLAAAAQVPLRRPRTALEGMVAGLDRIVLRPRRDQVSWAARTDTGRAALHAAPLDVSAPLADGVFRDLRGLVLTSATLRAGDDFEFLRERLGLPDAEGLALEAPFDLRSTLLVCAPADMPPPQAPDYQPCLDQTLIQLARASAGRMLVLYTSHAGLRRSYHAIRQPLGDAGIVVIGQGLDGPRHHLVETLRRGDHPTVLLGTRSMWEGIDVPGEALSVVVIARLPFDVPTDPVFQARAERFDDGFLQYAVPQSVLRFRQGLGRLIRGSRDRGVAVILDSRFHGRGYGQLFQEALPDCATSSASRTDVAAIARDFLERDEGAESTSRSALV